jgi:hypothetical protein
VKAKTVKADSDEVSTPLKKAKIIKAIDETKGKISKKAKELADKGVPLKKGEEGGDELFDGDDIFDLKELLGEDFLSEGGEGMGLLPNLDEDLAKLEANLSELGDFGFDFMDDDDDEALRSIESGKFDIERFLKEGDESLLEGLPNKNLKGTGEGGNLSKGKMGKGKGVEPNKKKNTTQSTLQQTIRGAEEDQDEDEMDGLEDESVSDRYDVKIFVYTSVCI